MEKDIKLGSAADLDLVFAAGVASVSLKATALDGSAHAVVKLDMDANVLIDKLFAAIEAASPEGLVSLEEGAKKMIKDAVGKL